MINCAVFVGSIRKGSYNKRLAHAMETLGAGVFTFTYVNIENLPLMNEDIENPLPPSVQAAKSIVEASQAVLFVTPEYNRSIPGVLKNAIDWCSRPYGANSFNGKPGAVVGIAPGPLGTSAAQAHLKSSLLMLGVSLMGAPEIYLTGKDEYFSPDGSLANPNNTVFIQSFLTQFAAWVAKF